jgi:GntR family transcriptional regulator
MRIPAQAVKPGQGPAHSQIEAWLERRLAHLSPGRRLPPERELSEQLGVSRMTLRHALQSLERRGLVVRRVGRDGGTFVAEPKLELAGTSALSDQLRGLGIAVGADVVEAIERDAERDETMLGERVIAIERVRYANREPVALERAAFAATAYPGLLEERLDGSIYDLLRARGDEVPARAVERLEPVAATADEAEKLAVDEGSPLMLVERVGYGRDGRALERSRDLFRGDRTRIVWETQIPERP